MSIEVQVEVSSEAGVDREYPWIGISEGLIVLFTDEKTGVVLADDKDSEGDYARDGVGLSSPGDHYDDWPEHEFREFKGTVTLSN